MKSAAKTPRQMERHLKGIANHYRIAILMLIDRQPGLSVDDIAGTLDRNFKTVSEHTRRLALAGLVVKSYVGRMVCHSLSPYGRTFVTFLKSFQHS